MSLGLPLIEELAPLLVTASVPWLSFEECVNLLKNLIVFANEFPLSYTDNLFVTDQISGKLNKAEEINWQWVLSQSFASNALNNNDTLEEQVWMKSRAVQMGRLMNGWSSPDADQVPKIVGFWLFTLYVTLKSEEIEQLEEPSQVLDAYCDFLEWKGDEWEQKSVSKRRLRSLLMGLRLLADSKLLLDPCDNSSSTRAMVRICRFWRAEETSFFKKFCNNLEKRQLSQYLEKSYNGTLDEFGRSEVLTEQNQKVTYRFIVTSNGLTFKVKKRSARDSGMTEDQCCEKTAKKRCLE